MARKGNDTGSIWRRADGVWVGQISVTGPDGKRHRPHVQGQTRAEVQRKLNALLAEKEEGGLRVTPNITLERFLADWLESYVRVNCASSTYRLYRHMCRDHVVPALGQTRLSNIHPLQLQTLFANVMRPKGTLAPSSVQRLRTILSGAFHWAVDMEMLKTNPVASTKMPKGDPSDINPWTMDEMRAFLLATEQHRQGPVFLFFAASGLRINELAALRDVDVDLDRGVFHVRTQLQRETGVGVVRKEPKTRSSKRTLPIPLAIIPALREYVVRREELRARKHSRPPGYYTRQWKDTDSFFISDNGTPIEQSNFNRLCKALAKKAGVRQARLHDFRHFFATMQLIQGTSMKVVQAQLGHASIRTTLDIYTHVMEELEREGMDSLGRLLVAPLQAEHNAGVTPLIEGN